MIFHLQEGREKIEKELVGVQALATGRRPVEVAKVKNLVRAEVSHHGLKAGRCLFKGDFLKEGLPISSKESIRSLISKI
jgi:hypothetical protein